MLTFSMRVSAETKSATRTRILETAERLFAANGFETTTTRDIAREAAIGTGTLFNYFSSKEAIVAAMAVDALDAVHAEFARGGPPGESLDEALFAFAAAGLRKLKRIREHVPALVEISLNPMLQGKESQAASLRLSHLDVVARLAAEYGIKELPALALQIYWSLYAGVLLFWARDKSPRQEDTLALLDHSLEMFAGWLDGQAEPSARNRTKR